MKIQSCLLTFALAVYPVLAHAQMMEPQTEMAAPAQKPSPEASGPQDPMPAADAAQQKAAKTFAGKALPAKKPQPTATAAKPAALTPLSPRERVAQLLDRFTFGPPARRRRPRARAGNRRLARRPVRP